MENGEHVSTSEYLAQYLRTVLEDRTVGATTTEDEPIHEYGAGHIDPTFWADAPWRLEPTVEEIPLTFIIRDGERDNVKMRLDEIVVYEAADDGKPWEDKNWLPVQAFTKGLGEITTKYWVYRPPPTTPLDPPPTIALSKFASESRGRDLLLKVVFSGTRLRPILGRRPFEEWLPLVIYLASEPLPLRESPQWYYGDTHYHSNYTNDVKEFGNSVPDTRASGERIGLDWLIITDHSVDLDDKNPYWETQRAESRWEELGAEALDHSDDRFRILRGEEVTLMGRHGKGDDTLHMLVMGDTFSKLIPGAWAKKSLLSDVAKLLGGFEKDLFSYLFGPVYRLDEVLTGVNKAGKPVPELEGRSVQVQGALAFAAHPATMAQAPGGIWEYEDLMQPIQGMEAWNSRIRVHAGKEQSPFDHWKEYTAWDDGKNKIGIETWDRMLKQKVGLDDPRFVLLAGSDAHGSFNYSVMWWPDWNGIRADDNCLGKVRTLIYLPRRDPNGLRNAPSEEELVNAIQAGSCIVTDGPVLNFTVGFGGQETTLGQILTVDGEGTIEVNVQAAPGAGRLDGQTEFGEVEQLNIIYFIQGLEETISESVTVPFRIGESKVFNQELPSGPGYFRLETTTRNEIETFRCFTNPIWVKSASPGKRRLRVSCVDW